MGEITADPTTWPKPNYVDPVTQVPLVLGCVIAILMLMNLFWGIRMWGRTTTKARLGLDDWLMSLAAVLSNVTCITLCFLTKYGVGRHIWDVPVEWIPTFSKIELVSDPIFAASLAITKISICTTYLRLFPNKIDRWFCYIMIAYNTGYALSIPFVMIFQCTPVALFWDKSLDGHCISFSALLLSTGITNSLSDCLVYLWPIRALWQVQLPKKQRIGLIFMFGFGVVVCLIGIIRLWYVIEGFFNNFDAFWGAAAGTILTATECCVGVICGCIPGIKPILAMLFPRFFSSYGSKPTTNAYGGATSRGAGSHYGGGGGASHSRSHHLSGTFHGQSFPFQHLSGEETAQQQKNKGVSVTVRPGNNTPESNSEPDLERGVASPQTASGPLSSHARGQSNGAPNNYAWAMGGGTTSNGVPSGRIGVSQQVSVRVEGERERGATRDDDSEEWIIQGARR